MAREIPRVEPHPALNSLRRPFDLTKRGPRVETATGRAAHAAPNSSSRLRPTAKHAELDGDLRKADVIKALEALNFRTAGSRHTLRIDREIKLLLLDALRRPV